MSSDQEKRDQGTSRELPGEQPAADQESDPASDASDAEPAEELDSELASPITLDRYLSKRRPAPHMGWPHIVTMLAMLVALIMILAYKESCGDAVSRFMSGMGVTGHIDADTPSR